MKNEFELFLENNFKKNPLCSRLNSISGGYYWKYDFLLLELYKNKEFRNNDSYIIEYFLSHFDFYCYPEFPKEKIVEILKLLIKEKTKLELLKILDKLYFSQIRKILLIFIEQLDYKSMKILINTDENSVSKIINIVILIFETSQILKDYKNFDFQTKPEFTESKHILKNDNYIKFNKYIEKLIKQNKPIMSLYLLNYFGGCGDNNSDYDLIINNYIKAFVSLERIDILAKYYDELELANDNIEFLVLLAEYYIKIKDSDNATLIINNITKIEPTYPFIKLGLNEIQKIFMINKLTADNIDIENINKLTGQEFEILLINKFKELGFKTIATPITGDYGADIIIETQDETRFIIQCKRFKSKVNLKAIQEVVGALAHYNGDLGIVITNSTFLNSAIKLADSNDIELWDNFRLMQFLSNDISFSQIVDS
ncbi:restriction endonuclease [Poseidonibacter antarcticus]|uniref:restriction endonuclease n=1 Tax=Poseidonibacter antarcticus TaxID=2478538 RepID=UPI000EF54304|nr:restriction endonuclease [Poseidonibacter antarcticus]